MKPFNVTIRLGSIRVRYTQIAECSVDVVVSAIERFGIGRITVRLA